MKLAGAYGLLHQAYSKVVEVGNSGKRMLGKYYRVKFYGQVRGIQEENIKKKLVIKRPSGPSGMLICFHRSSTDHRRRIMVSLE